MRSRSEFGPWKNETAVCQVSYAHINADDVVLRLKGIPIPTMVEVTSRKMFKELRGQEWFGATGIDTNGRCKGFELVALAIA